MSIKRTTKFAALAVGSVSLFAGSAVADPSATGTPGGTPIVLQVATKQMYQASLPVRNGNTKVARLTGSGAVDTYVTFQGNTIGMVWTASDATPNNDNSYFRGMFSIAKLGEKGLETTGPGTVAPKMIAKLQGDRTFMRPQATFLNGGKYLVLIAAAEENGVNNGNPQAVATVIDTATGATKNITQTNGTFRQGTFVNLITLGGNNDAQQYGPHSVCQVNDNTAIVGVQRNNQNAYVLKFSVTDQPDGSVKVTSTRNKVIQNAQHSRVQLACPPGGYKAPITELVATSVEANAQPANIGVRALAFDTNTLQVRTSKLIAASAPNQNIYAVQPNIAYVSPGVVAVQYQEASKLQTRNNGNAHKGGANVAKLITLNAQTLEKLDSANTVAPSARHADACGVNLGINGEPGVGVISGAITGTGPGLMQVHPVDATTGKIAPIDRVGKLFQVSKFSDVGGNAVRGKRNPNNQGRGFIRCTSGIANPGYGKTDGFMNDVKSFTMTLAQGYEAMPTTSTSDVPEHPYLSLVPAAYNAPSAVPGPVVPADSVPPGPSPSAPSGSGTGGGSGNGTGGGENGAADPFTPSGYDGFNPNASQSSGCSVASTSSNAGTFGLFGIVAGLAALVARRRR